MSHAPPPDRRFRAAGPSFITQFGLLVVLPLAALAIVIPLASLWLHARAMRLMVAERDGRAVQAAAAAISRDIEHRASAVRGLALYAATGASPHQTLAEFTYLLSEFGGGLALFDGDNRLLVATHGGEAWTERPVTDLARRATGSADPVFSAVFHDSAYGGPAVLVAARAHDGPLAVGAFEPATLIRPGLLALLGHDSQASLWLLSADGQLLFHVGAEITEAHLGDHPGVAEALRGEAGETYLSVNGGEHVVAYSPVEPVGWALLLEEPWEAVDNPLLRSTLAAPLVLIPVVLFSLLVLALGIRQVVQPLRRLAHSAGELGLGRYEAVEAPVGGIAEIRHLQTELVHMARQVRAAQQSLRGYVSAVTRGQEDERRRLARELHDGPVQALVALDQRVQMIQLKLQAETPELTERLIELRQMTAALLEDVRRVIRALRPIYLEDLGLLPALEMLARDLGSSTGIKVAFRTEGTPVRLPAEREIAAYRFAQEALSNVGRHSQAATVEVTAAFAPDLFTLRVADDGQGFALPERLADWAAGSHFGLLGMQERAELVGGRLNIESAPERGTTVELRLPIKA
jgi:signal transduction histidine kinase